MTPTGRPRRSGVDHSGGNGADAGRIAEACWCKERFASFLGTAARKEGLRVPCSSDAPPRRPSDRRCIREGTALEGRKSLSQGDSYLGCFKDSGRVDTTDGGFYLFDGFRRRELQVCRTDAQDFHEGEPFLEFLDL